MKYKLMFTAAGLSLLLAGCSFGGTMDADKEAAFMQELLEAPSAADAKELIVSNKDRLSEIGMVEAVDSYIQKVTAEADAATSSAMVYEETFLTLDAKTWKDYEGDEELTMLLDSIEEQPVILFDEKQYFGFLPDYATISEEFRGTVHPSMTDYLDFAAGEQVDHYFKADEEQLDMDILRDRLELLDTLVEEHDDSPVSGSFHTSRSFYAALYFGTNHLYFIDEEEVLMDDIKAHYEETAKMDLSISPVLGEYLKKLEEFEWKPNDPNVLVWMMDNGLLEEGTQGIPVGEEVSGEEAPETDEAGDE